MGNNEQLCVNKEQEDFDVHGNNYMSWNVHWKAMFFLIEIIICSLSSEYNVGGENI
jgi:Ca2+/H+ antiporter